MQFLLMPYNTKYTFSFDNQENGKQNVSPAHFWDKHFLNLIIRFKQVDNCHRPPLVEKILLCNLDFECKSEYGLFP
jgi:hypothetical protein